MKLLRRCLLFSVALALCARSAALAQAPSSYDPAAKAKAVAPYLDDLTVAVIQINVAKFDGKKSIEDMQKRLKEAKLDPLDDKQIKTMLDQEALIKKNIKEVTVVVSLTDIAIQMPAYGIVKLQPGADPAKALSQMMGIAESGDSPEAQQFAADVTKEFMETYTLVVGDTLYVGHKRALDRLKDFKPTANANLEQAFKVAGDTTVQALYIPTPEALGVMSIFARQAPADLPFDVKGLMDAVTYAAVGMDSLPNMQLRLGIQAKDKAGADKLLAAMKKAIDMMKEDPAGAKPAELLTTLLPQQKEDRLFTMVKADDPAVKSVTDELLRAVGTAREAAQRMQSMNNLKQFALAMHNYLSAMDKFPPAYTAKDGKPLLSWRVHILPYIEQQALYEQFKLDEPWDSAHNKKLIEKMPKIYGHPKHSLKPGTTCYLLPVGETTIFGGERKPGFAEIRDGTSNTILIVEANPDQAVEWTKPADLEVELDKPMKGLGKVWTSGGFLTAFADGSVRFLTDKIAPETMKRLLEKADGQVVDIP